MPKHLVPYKETDPFNNLIEKYFDNHLKTDSPNKIENLNALDKSQLLNFAVDILNNRPCFNKDVILDFFEQINRTIDDYLEDNEQIKEQFDLNYNITLLSILSDITYLQYKQEEIYNELNKKISVLSNKNYKAIITALYKYKALSQRDLAKHIKTTTQNLSNCLAKLKPHNVIYVFKSPLDKKSTFYSLNIDFSRAIQNNKLLLHNIGQNEEENIINWKFYNANYFLDDEPENSEFEYIEHFDNFINAKSLKQY